MSCFRIQLVFEFSDFLFFEKTILLIQFDLNNINSCSTLKGNSPLIRTPMIVSSRILSRSLALLKLEPLILVINYS